MALAPTRRCISIFYYLVSKFRFRNISQGATQRSRTIRSRPVIYSLLVVGSSGIDLSLGSRSRLLANTTIRSHCLLTCTLGSRSLLATTTIGSRRLLRLLTCTLFCSRLRTSVVCSSLLDIRRPVVRSNGSSSLGAGWPSVSVSGSTRTDIVGKSLFDIRPITIRSNGSRGGVCRRNCILLRGSTKRLGERKSTSSWTSACCRWVAWSNCR